MASENVERQMEFILEQQAQGTVRLGQLEDLVVRFAQATRDRFEIHNHRFDDIDQKIAALVDSQMRAKERGKEIDAKISALVDSQVRTEANVKKTDEALRSLITELERHTSEGRNGNLTDRQT